jgi:hypothetical protein
MFIVYSGLVVGCVVFVMWVGVAGMEEKLPVVLFELRHHGRAGLPPQHQASRETIRASPGISTLRGFSVQENYKLRTE